MNAETKLNQMTFKEIEKKGTTNSPTETATPLPACPGCAMIKNDWPGEGYSHEGETYCCQGCAEGKGCTCSGVAQPGFSREGQKRTEAETRPGEQRAGSLTPQGELSGERDALGTGEAIDEPDCSGKPANLK
jgi:hypothetical protein